MYLSRLIFAFFANNFKPYDIIQNMNFSEQRKGELAILGESIITSLMPIISLLSFQSLKPLYSLGYSLIFTTIFFFFIVAFKGRLKELLTPGVLKNMLWVVLLIGVCYYGIYFFSLKYTSANNAGIILQMELFFSFLFFNVWKKEALTTEHLYGAALMLFSTLLIFFPQINKLQFNKGDLLILLCTAFPPIGNYFQRKIRYKISSESLVLLRSGLTVPFIFILAYLLNNSTFQIPNSQNLLFLLLNGLLILGISKIFWLEAILRISITKANALSSVKPFLTIILSFLLIKELPNAWQIASVLPMLLGVYLLTRPSPALETI